MLHPGAVQSGCTANTVGDRRLLLRLRDAHAPARHPARADDRGPRQAARHRRPEDLHHRQREGRGLGHQAVNWVLPANSRTYNPAHNAATEVLIQPGTGKVLAIAEDRPYGTGPGQTEVDYAVNSQYGGSDGIQTGSSSKLFTLITALEQGVPFGFQLTVPGTQTVTGYTNCAGAVRGRCSRWRTPRAPATSTDTLYTGTTGSINVFFAHLEQKVGPVQHGEDRGEPGHDPGRRQVAAPGGRPRPARRRTTCPPSRSASSTSRRCPWPPRTRPRPRTASYCSPIVLTKIVDDTGKSLPVPSAGCHQAIPVRVAQAVNYILQGVLTYPNGTAYGSGLAGYQAAGKTGTSNVASGNGTPYAAFAGYTTALAGYVSVFNPVSPDDRHDDRYERVLPRGKRRPELPGRDVRRQRAAVGMAHDLRPRRPGRLGELPAGPVWQRPVERGHRPGRPSRRPRQTAQAAATAAAATAGAAEAAVTAGGGGGNGGGGERGRQRRRAAAAMAGAAAAQARRCDGQVSPGGPVTSSMNVQRPLSTYRRGRAAASLIC